MSPENVEVVRGWLSTWAEWLHSDRDPDRLTDLARMHVEGLEVGEVIDAGDLILARVKVAMLGPDGGHAIGFVWTYTLRVEDGLIAHFRAWYDPEEAARAAGLTE
jgi:hypothetical protein